MPFTAKYPSYSQFDIESNTFSRKNWPWIKSHLMNVLASITSRKGYWCPTKKLKIYFESAETAEFNKNESIEIKHTVLSVSLIRRLIKTYSMAQSWYIYNLRISRWWACFWEYANKFVHQYSVWYITFRPPSGESAWCFYKNISLLTGVEETNMKVSIAHRVENHSVGARERLHILFFYMVYIKRNLKLERNV